MFMSYFQQHRFLDLVQLPTGRPFTVHSKCLRKSMLLTRARYAG